MHKVPKSTVDTYRADLSPNEQAQFDAVHRIIDATAEYGQPMVFIEGPAACHVQESRESYLGVLNCEFDELGFPVDKNR